MPATQRRRTKALDWRERRNPFCGPADRLWAKNSAHARGRGQMFVRLINREGRNNAQRNGKAVLVDVKSYHQSGLVPAVETTPVLQKACRWQKWIAARAAAMPMPKVVDTKDGCAFLRMGPTLTLRRWVWVNTKRKEGGSTTALPTKDFGPSLQTLRAHPSPFRVLRDYWQYYRAG